MYKKSLWQEINIYPNWLYCMLEWYVELTMRHTIPGIHCTQICSLTMATKAIFCQLPTTYCFYSQPCSSNTLRLYKSPQFGKAATATNKIHRCWLVRQCSKFVNTHLYHSRQSFNIHRGSEWRQVRSIPPGDYACQKMCDPSLTHHSWLHL